MHLKKQSVPLELRYYRWFGKPKLVPKSQHLIKGKANNHKRKTR